MSGPVGQWPINCTISYSCGGPRHMGHLWASVGQHGSLKGTGPWWPTSGPNPVGHLNHLILITKTTTGPLAHDFQTPSLPLSLSNVNCRTVKL